jgi:hypothetical protein
LDELAIKVEKEFAWQIEKLEWDVRGLEDDLAECSKDNKQALDD